MPQIVNDNREEIERDRKLGQQAVTAMMDSLFMKFLAPNFMMPMKGPKPTRSLLDIPVLTSDAIDPGVAVMVNNTALRGEQRLRVLDPKAIVKINYT